MNAVLAFFSLAVSFAAFVVSLGVTYVGHAALAQRPAAATGKPWAARATGRVAIDRRRELRDAQRVAAVTSISTLRPGNASADTPMIDDAGFASAGKKSRMAR